MSFVKFLWWALSAALFFPSLTLDIETDAAQEPAVREVLARLHPDRRPAILVTAAA